MTPFPPRLFSAAVTANRDLQSFFSPGVYLVTGGAGGFGSRLVYGMVHYGADHVVVTVSKDVSRIDPIFASLRKKSPHAIIEAVEADLSKEEDVQKVVDHLRATGKPLRGIFHSAGTKTFWSCMERSRADLASQASGDGCMLLLQLRVNGYLWL